MTTTAQTTDGWFGYLGPCEAHRPTTPPDTPAEIWDHADEPCEACDDRLAADFETWDRRHP